LTPHRWTRGIRQARGEAVALTIADCQPAADWAAAALQALDERPRAAAIGGVMELNPAGSPADWALFFLRYSAYLPPVRRGPIVEIAADNGVYRRAALERYPETWHPGFWEPTVHAAFRRAGMDIVLDPRLVVTHKHSLTVAAFSRQRFVHGRAFGAARFGASPVGQRALRVLAAPAAAGVLLARVTARVFAKRRHRLRLLASLPILGWFTVCWIAGETTGYLLGPPCTALLDEEE
jgi:hypothetical protein